MGRCRKLEEYAIFIGCVREFLKSTEPAEAIRKAMELCIEKGILAVFLSQRRAEVMNALLTEYDEEKVMKSLSKEFYEDGYEDGREAGLAEGLAEGIHAFVSYNLEVGKSGEQIVSEMIKIFSLSKAQAEKNFAEFTESFC